MRNNWIGFLINSKKKKSIVFVNYHKYHDNVCLLIFSIMIRVYYFIIHVNDKSKSVDLLLNEGLFLIFFKTFPTAKVFCSFCLIIYSLWHFYNFFKFFHIFCRLKFQTNYWTKNYIVDSFQQTSRLNSHNKNIKNKIKLTSWFTNFILVKLFQLLN